MCPTPQYTRLRLLIDESLHSFFDLAFGNLTAENEKGVLSVLSLVFRQVKQWTEEADSDEELPEASQCSVSADSDLDNCHCLAKIIGDLIFWLAVNSQYIRHLAGKTLVAISEFVLTVDIAWDDFMHLLCVCLELAISECLTTTSCDPAPMETRYSDCGLSNSKSLLKLKLKNSNWFVVAGIFQVLRGILKNLKQDFDEEVLKEYLDAVSSLMLYLPWDTSTAISVGYNSKSLNGSAQDVSSQTKIQLREITLYFGNLIQFLCSMVSKITFPDGGVGLMPVFSKIINLVPKLAGWCHTELRSTHSSVSSHYFRHKVLILMIKLTSRTDIEESVLMEWMHLLHNYFEDLLSLPIPMVEFDQYGSLEGSPFSTGVLVPGMQSMSRHLQRLTVFLFFKCTLSLVNIKGSAGEQHCTYENPKHYLAVDVNLNSEGCGNHIGLGELHTWLRAHVPADMTVNDEFYLERCVRFSLSFLQLFMNEDDILFDMLLQLFHVPFHPDHQVGKDCSISKAMNRETFLASDLFNPVHLFHLFLGEIHYDHQVLVDYLISKDTGSSCAEYLLRSLRIICNSWSLFVEFPGIEGSSDQLCPKRQKVSVLALPSESVKDGGISSLTNLNEGRAHGKQHCRNYRLPFLSSRKCLLSLTTSIDSLNRKNLFPYNPKVLLRRLMRFQELCNEK